MNVLTTSLLALVMVVAEVDCSLAAEAAGGGKAAVCDIATATHCDQLRSQRPIRLGDNWEVRLGLGDGGAEAGPWRLLYCHANWTNENESPSLAYNGESLGEPLGPVFYRVFMDGETPLAACAQVMFAAEDTPPEGLYCGMVLTAWQGKYHVEILSQDDRIIAHRTIDVPRPRPLYWQEFARQKDTILQSPVAARPAFVGTWPLWENGGRIASQLHQRCPLPGTLPTPNAWIDYVSRKATAIRDGERIYPLTLSLAGGDFVVRSPVKLVDWPDLYLLARWWVNDQPISPRRPEGISMRSIGRQVSSTQEMRIRFGLPDTLGQLEPGDKIGLQVLYSPAMIEQVPIGSNAVACLHAALPHDSNMAAVPMTSNRIEFTVTRAMLAQRARVSKLSTNAGENEGAENNVAGPTASLRVSKNAFEVGEPIFVHLRLRNTSSYTLIVPDIGLVEGKGHRFGIARCFERGIFRLSLERDGKQIRGLMPPEPSLRTVSEEMPIQVKELAARREIEVDGCLSSAPFSKLFPFDHPGRYVLTPVFDTTNPANENVWRGRVAMPSVSFTVKPRPAFRDRRPDEPDGDYARARVAFYVKRITERQGVYFANVVEILKTQRGVLALIQLLDSADREETQCARDILAAIHSRADSQTDERRIPQSTKDWLNWYNTEGTEKRFEELWGNFDSHYQ